MRGIERYTPADIRLCGKLLYRVLDSGETVERLLTLSDYLRAHGTEPHVLRYRLEFITNIDKDFSPSEILQALGIETLRSYVSLKKLFLRRGISEEQVKERLRYYRKEDLARTKFGKRTR